MTLPTDYCFFERKGQAMILLITACTINLYNVQVLQMEKFVNFVPLVFLFTLQALGKSKKPWTLYSTEGPFGLLIVIKCLLILDMG
jgi:hypothetical protein